MKKRRNENVLHRSLVASEISDAFNACLCCVVCYTTVLQPDYYICDPVPMPTRQGMCFSV